MQEEIRKMRSELVHEIERAGVTVRNSSFCCPFCDDKHPSGSIYQGSDGVWRLKCHKCGFCGDIYDFRAKIEGKKLGDVLPKIIKAYPDTKNEVFVPKAIKRPSPPKPPKPVAPLPPSVASDEYSEFRHLVFGRIEAAYRYAEDFAVVRYFPEGSEKKLFYQAHRNGGNLWAKGAIAKPYPLYNLEGIKNEPFVVVVEGEKCVEALKAIRTPATTSCGGANNAANTDWTPLAGKGQVVLWADNDEPGRAHMKAVAEILKRLNPPPRRILWLEPELLDLPEKGDVCDFLNDKLDCVEDKAAAIFKLWDTCQTISADGSGELKQMLKDTIVGKRESVKFPWAGLSHLTKALLPGTVTLICGNPGATKSFFVLECAQYWRKSGYKVAVYELEEDCKFHLHRALAQMEGNSDITDDDWLKKNEAETMAAFGRHEKLISDLGQCIWDAPDKQLKLREVADWVEERAKSGCRIIAVDPITVADPDGKQWEKDLEFMLRVKTIARQKQCSVILVTHPRKGSRGLIGLDELSGGAAYQRFSQTVMWIEWVEEMERMVKLSMGGCAPQMANRIIHLSKVRNGSGERLQIGYLFDKNTFCFEEVGVIIPEKKKGKK